MSFYLFLFLIVAIPSAIGVVLILIEEHFAYKHEMTLPYNRRSEIYK